MSKKILIIEDEPSIRELVSYNMNSAGYETIIAEDGIKGITLVYKAKPDLILLDIMLPGKDGYEICKELRSQDINTPIIMMTAKTDEVDKVLGLEFGADDYISKPFGVRELLARVKAVLRRYDAEPKASRDYEKEKSLVADKVENLIVIDNLIIDHHKHEVRIEDQIYDLTFKEFELLSFLAKNRGRVFSREELLDKVWGIDYFGESRTVDVHIRHLRKKMGDKGGEEKYIATIRGRGYKVK